MRGLCRNRHNFVRFILMKNTTWSCFFLQKRTQFFFKVSSPQALTKLLSTDAVDPRHLKVEVVN